MKFWICLVVASLVTVGCGPRPGPGSVLISNVTLVSPDRPAPVKQAWILIEGERIMDSGTGEPEIGAARVIDGRGRYLMPGLIDGHVHLEGVAGMAYPLQDKVRSLVDEYYQQLPRSYLYFGFTTVVDLNVLSREFIEAMKAAPLGPDIYDCDGALALANGYPMAFFPPETRFDSHPNFLYDERQADAIPSRFFPADHAPAAVVKRVFDAGGICVKLHHEDGFGPQSIWPVPGEELIAEVIGEARRHDLKVLMHANSYAAYRFAADAGVDAIVHGMWNWDGMGEDGAGLPMDITAVADELLEQDIAFMPTLRVLGGLQALYDPEFLDDPHLPAVLPAGLMDWYRSADGRWFADELRQDFDGLSDEQIPARMQFAIDQGAAVAGYLADRGGKLVFGSDTPSAPTYGNPPGYNGFLELKTLAAIGIPPERLMRAATVDAARALGLDDRLGTIEPGKIANLLVLNENPLQSVEAYDTIDLVILRGKVIRREELAANR